MQEKRLKIYMAPLEGVTGMEFRRTHREFYPGVDKYYIPFIEPRTKRAYSTKELREIDLKNNEGAVTVPQILTKNPEDFLNTAKALLAEGYEEVNLNLGCPSPTVVSKGKGSGFLEFPNELRRCLDRIYEGAEGPISIKTRTGRYEHEEFGELVSLYNAYPVHELTVHPRTREDYYKGPVSPDAYEVAYKNAKAPLCYNGDLFSAEDVRKLLERFPDTPAVMLGRGLVASPWLAQEIITGEKPSMAVFRDFHDRLYERYTQFISGNKNLLYKMKELWYYWGWNFTGEEKMLKKIKKAKTGEEYLALAHELISRKA